MPAEQLPVDPKPIRDLLDKVRALIDKVQAALPEKPSQDLPGRGDAPLRGLYKVMLALIAEIAKVLQDLPRPDNTLPGAGEGGVSPKMYTASKLGWNRGLRFSRFVC